MLNSQTIVCTGLKTSLKGYLTFWLNPNYFSLFSVQNFEDETVRVIFVSHEAKTYNACLFLCVELRKHGSSNQESGKCLRVGNVAVDKENAARTGKAIGISFKKQEKRKKCLDKWDSIAKINHIYADWIESPPPVRVISGNQ